MLYIIGILDQKWLNLSCSLLTFQILQSLRRLVGNELLFPLQIISDKRNITRLSLPFCYFNFRCSGELQSFVPQVQNVTARIRQTAYTFITFIIQLVRIKFHGFFSRFGPNVIVNVFIIKTSCRRFLVHPWKRDCQASVIKASV